MRWSKIVLLFPVVSGAGEYFTVHVYVHYDTIPAVFTTTLSKEIAW